jgi:hypothetical protein
MGNYDIVHIVNKLLGTGDGRVRSQGYTPCYLPKRLPTLTPHKDVQS